MVWTANYHNGSPLVWVQGTGIVEYRSNVLLLFQQRSVRPAYWFSFRSQCIQVETHSRNPSLPLSLTYTHLFSFGCSPIVKPCSFYSFCYPPPSPTQYVFGLLRFADGDRISGTSGDVCLCSGRSTRGSGLETFLSLIPCVRCVCAARNIQGHTRNGIVQTIRRSRFHTHLPHLLTSILGLRVI
jgi:hypothetical protein